MPTMAVRVKHIWSCPKRSLDSALETDAQYRSGAAEGGRAAPGDPRPGLGRYRAGMGPRGTCPLNRLVGVLQGEPGRLREGCAGAWTGGQGAPNDTPRPARRVGGGRGVCARENRVHGAEPPWRRPLACGKPGTKGPSERASGPRGSRCRLEKGAGTLQGGVPWSRPAGVAPCAGQAARTVLNGREEETYRKATRLV